MWVDKEDKKSCHKNTQDDYQRRTDRVHRYSMEIPLETLNLNAFNLLSAFHLYDGCCQSVGSYETFCLYDATDDNTLSYNFIMQ